MFEVGDRRAIPQAGWAGRWKGWGAVSVMTYLNPGPRQTRAEEGCYPGGLPGAGPKTGMLAGRPFHD
jgi:hypothetical protein